MDLVKKEKNYVLKQKKKVKNKNLNIGTKLHEERKSPPHVHLDGATPKPGTGVATQPDN